MSIFNIASSQTIRNKTFDEFYSKKMIESSISKNSLDISDIQGSPYLNNDFQTGSIVTTSNTNYNDISIRYNIFNDEMEFKGNDNNIYSFEKSTIKNLFIGNTEYVFKAFSIKNSLRRSYFEVLTKGTVTLLKQYHVRFEEEQPAKAFADPVPAKFNRLRSDYFIFSNKEAQKFSGFKDLSELLPDKRTEIEKFIKSKKLKISNEEDIIKVIDFYNSEK